MRSIQQPPAGDGPDTRRRPPPTRRRLVGIVTALVVLAVAVVTLTVFQPQRLLIDERVDEAAPAAPDATGPGAAPGAGQTGTQDGQAQAPDEQTGTQPAEPAVSQAGSFHGLAHAAEGTARLLRLDDGRQVLRLENLKVENGPDLYVYLSAATADGPASAHDDDFVSLGRLKGNQGNQNYALPGDVDPARYRSVVIWCRRFAVGFAAAPLH